MGQEALNLANYILLHQFKQNKFVWEFEIIKIKTNKNYIIIIYYKNTW